MLRFLKHLRWLQNDLNSIAVTSIERQIIIMNAKISGVGHYIPGIVTDEDFAEVYGERANKVSRILQHHSRYLATDIRTNKQKVSNLDMGYLASVEAGKRNNSIKNIQKIANGLNVSCGELLSYTENKK